MFLRYPYIFSECNVMRLWFYSRLVDLVNSWNLFLSGFSAISGRWNDIKLCFLPKFLVHTGHLYVDICCTSSSHKPCFACVILFRMWRCLQLFKWYSAGFFPCDKTIYETLKLPRRLDSREVLSLYSILYQSPKWNIAQPTVLPTLYRPITYKSVKIGNF